MVTFSWKHLTMSTSFSFIWYSNTNKGWWWFVFHVSSVGAKFHHWWRVSGSFALYDRNQINIISKENPFLCKNVIKMRFSHIRNLVLLACYLFSYWIVKFYSTVGDRRVIENASCIRLRMFQFTRIVNTYFSSTSFNIFPVNI